MNIPDILSCRSGAAAGELAMLLPLLVLLLFGGFEAGHFMWTQHKLVEAVRNGARFAGRTPVREVCDGTVLVVTQDTLNEINLVTRTGQLASSTAMPVVRTWTPALVDVQFHCDAFVDTGIYSDLEPGVKGPVVTVAATGVPYPLLFPWLGTGGDQPLGGGFPMYARASAPVIGL